MKKQLIAFFVAGHFLATAHADTPEQPSTLADATQMVAAETNITLDVVAQMLRSLADQSSQVEFNARDYRVKTVNFQQRVSAALQAFEAQMQNSIFRKLSSLANRYNAIYNSTTITPDQKQLLLLQQFSAAQSQVQLIQQEYHQAIKTVYQVVGDLPLELQINWIRNPRIRDRRSHGCTRLERGYVEFVYEAPLSGRRVVTNRCVKRSYNRYRSEIHHRFGSTDVSVLNDNVYLDIRIESTHYTNARALSGAVAQPWLSSAGLVDATQVYQSLIYPELRRRCRSQTCLALSAADLRAYLNLVSTSIDREIYIPLADGSAGFRLQASGIQVGGLMNLLSSMNYPVEVQDLPFDTE